MMEIPGLGGSVTKNYISLFIAATLFVGVPRAWATCTACSDTLDYGTGVISDTANTTGDITSFTSDMTSGFTDTAQALQTTGDDIVSALMANASEVSMEVDKASTKRTGLFEALQNSDERLSKSRFVADNNMHVAMTQGPENIHSSLCSPFSRETDHEMVARLLNEHRVRQIEERTDDFRVRTSDYSVAMGANIGDNIYTPMMADVAMQQASLITGENSFPVSPDTMAAMAAKGSGGYNKSTSQLINAWVRSSSAGMDLAASIAKRTRPNIDPEAEDNAPQPMAIFEELWVDVEGSMSLGGIKEDSSATEAKLMRAIARRGALSNKIKLEQLENSLSIARMSGAQVGFLAEQALARMDKDVESNTVEAAVESGYGE